MSERKDRREERSRARIREAFLQLIQKKRVERISVGELCTLADINRSTFYRHYLDIYDLFEELVDQCVEEIFHAFASQLNPNGDMEQEALPFIIAACEQTEKRRDLYKMLLFDQPASNLQQRLTDEIYRIYFDAHARHYPESPQKAIHYRYLVSGIMGIWSEWLRTDCQMPKEIVADAVKDHLSAFFYLMTRLYAPEELGQSVFF